MYLWEGFVIEVKKETFIARLIDLNNGENEEIAEFYIDDIAPDDRHLLKIGSPFYWYIGYKDKVNGDRIKESFIRFRRLPKWSKMELERAKVEAKRFMSNVNWGLKDELEEGWEE